MIKLDSKKMAIFVSFLNQLARELTSYYKTKLPKTNEVNISVNIMDNHIDYIIKGDKILLYWAFENIIKNSIDSIKNKGEINLNIIKNKNNITVDILDNGIGIKRKNKKHIFNPGYSTKSRGWGLGLNLSKRIIEKIHKGSLKLLSSNSNVTIFRVNLRSFIS